MCFFLHDHLFLERIESFSPTALECLHCDHVCRLKAFSGSIPKTTMKVLFGSSWIRGLSPVMRLTFMHWPASSKSVSLCLSASLSLSPIFFIGMVVSLFLLRLWFPKSDLLICSEFTKLRCLKKTFRVSFRVFSDQNGERFWICDGYQGLSWA